MVNETAKSFCGSPAYLSPEMVKQKGKSDWKTIIRNKIGVGRASDMYAIGVLLYEMLQGVPPYFNLSTSKMYKLISGGKLEFIKEASDEAKSLIRVKKKKKRI